MRKNGFTIIELILVITVMGVASAGLAAVIQEAIRETHQTEVISTATGLAVREAERVAGLPFAGVADEYRDNPQSYTGSLSNYSRQVRVDSIDNAQPNLGSDAAMQSYKVVEVRVHHSAVGYVPLRFLKTKYY